MSPLRRLAHPRSRRSQLWASVCCGAFERDAATDSDGTVAENR